MMEISFEFYNELILLFLTIGIMHHITERFQVFLALQCSISYVKYYCRTYGFSFQHIQPTKWIEEAVICVRQQFFLQARRKESQDDESECVYSLIVY
jgi:hypothetical protein